MHTEEEAKKKWCPHAQRLEYEDHSTTKCIGSACMAWRWGEWAKGSEFGERGPAVRGYCGLSGKPD